MSQGGGSGGRIACLRPVFPLASYFFSLSIENDICAACHAIGLNYVIGREGEMDQRECPVFYETFSLHYDGSHYYGR